jgi:hypothetical protein
VNDEAQISFRICRRSDSPGEEEAVNQSLVSRATVQSSAHVGLKTLLPPNKHLSMIAYHYGLALSRMMCIECTMAEGCMCCHMNQAPFHPTETRSLIVNPQGLAT